ncbi:hypothetical protein BC351_05660 [Paenibacillus ferrarius]|uniref:Uncharacterized protein n=1 Tax=Paenibacillus ferrarius TaxID=1469647 RepID=A0A1V4HGP2_9BACL|nr:hypothetical protein BC351_05660 [Paenibacillus ferrarius]
MVWFGALRAWVIWVIGLLLTLWVLQILWGVLSASGFLSALNTFDASGGLDAWVIWLLWILLMLWVLQLLWGVLSASRSLSA